MSHPDLERLTIATTTDLVEILPMLLGFHPEESLVVVAVDANQVVVTARTDLPGPTSTLSPALGQLWARFPSACFVFIGLSSRPHRAWEALRALDADLPEGTQRRYLVADGERWYEAPTDPTGTPYDRVGNVHLARAAFGGRPVRSSRDELTALLEPAWSPADVRAALVRVEARLGGVRDLRARADALLAAHTLEGPDLTLDDATLLCLASHDQDFLDAHLWALTKDTAATHQRLWLQVVRGSVPACSGGALIGLGISAWLAGEGAVHTVCLEKLGRVAGPPDWVDLLDLINTAALSPDDWETLREQRRTLLPLIGG